MMKLLSRPLSSIKPSVTLQKSRIVNIERLRILSASAVASFHTHDWFPRSLGLIGFVILILVFCTFVVNRPEPYDLANLAKRKAKRLLKPWVFWSLVYGVIALAKVVCMDESFSEVFFWRMLLVGTRIHLWFLPFAFVAALLLALIHRRIMNISDTYNIVTATLIGTLCVFGCSILQSCVNPPVPLGQWSLGLPAIPLGFAIGRIMLQQNVKDRRNFYIFVVLSVAAVYGICTVLAWLQTGACFDNGCLFAMQYFISTTVFCSALHWHGRIDPISMKLGSLSYGIYLAHPLVLIFLNRLGIATQTPIVLLFLTLSASMLLTYVFKKTLLRQFV